LLGGLVAGQVRAPVAVSCHVQLALGRHPVAAHGGNRVEQALVTRAEQPVHVAEIVPGRGAVRLKTDQRADDHAAVAQPRVAVVVVAFAADDLGERGGDCGSNRTSRFVGEQA